MTVYHLEMCDPEAFLPKVAPAGFEVAIVAPPEPGLNRQFYCDVGAPWKWTDRLAWSDADWHEYVHRDALRTWVGRLAGEAVGYFELETQEQGNVQICYFGLLPEFIGQGLGGALLSAAVQCAWGLPDSRRVWVHTCTDDHAHALRNYQKRGFEVFEIERD
jgi:GNAT superfamily N-acetyltransferase